MADKPAYSFVDATFAFFQAVGRRPVGAIWITLWHLILYTALTLATLALVAPFFQLVLAAAAEGREPDEAEILGAASGLIAGYSFAVLGFLVAALMVQAAWLRFLARDQIAAIIPLRFGADELRLLVVNIAFIAFNIIAWTAVFIVFALLNAGVIAAISAGDGGVGAAVGAGVINVLLALAIGVAAVIIMIRFAAAPALTVRLRAIKLFESFTATKGVTAWMFVSYLTLIGVYLVGSVVVWTVQQIVILVAAADLFPTLAALENTEDPEVVLRVLGEVMIQPTVLITIGLVVLLQMALQIVFEGSWHGVGAYAARREAGDFPSDAVETPTGSVGAAPDKG